MKINGQLEGNLMVRLTDTSCEKKEPGNAGLFYLWPHFNRCRLSGPCWAIGRQLNADVPKPLPRLDKPTTTGPKGRCLEP